MSRSLALRAARQSDIPVLAAIRREAILKLATPEYGIARARAWADSSADERVLRAIEQNEVCVAEQASATVGWIEIARDRVEGLYVRPDVSGSGIGSALLRHAEHLIRSAGHCAAALDASRNAEEFYSRRGYRAQAEAPTEAGLPMLKPLSRTDGH